MISITTEESIMGKKVEVADSILKCWQDYSGLDGWIWPPVAVRYQDDFYAVLLDDKDEGCLLAITFNQVLRDGEIVWDVTDEGVEFGSIKEFLGEGLTKRLL